MMEAPGLIAPPLDDITEEVVRSTYEVGTNFLRSQYEYIFSKPDGVTEAYSLGTWTFKIKASEVMKHGTDADKARLQGGIQKHKQKRTVTPGIRRRQSKIAKKGTGRKSAVVVDRVEDEDGAGDGVNDEHAV